MLKLSVLVTFYNQEKYVDQALESVLGQRVEFDYEVLIGDDGSDDGTWGKLQSWRDRFPEKIKLFQHTRPNNEKNNQPLLARRRGSLNRLFLVKQAQGEYLALLDGDDYYTDFDKFQIQVDLLENPSNQDCVGCAHPADKIWPDGRIEHVNNPAMKEQKFTPERYAGVMHFVAATLIYRNHFRDYVPEDLFKRFNLTEITLNAWLLQFGSFYYLPKVMLHYRQHGASICNNQNQLEKYVSAVATYEFESLALKNCKNALAWRYRHIFKALYQAKLDLASVEFDEFRTNAQAAGDDILLLWLNYRDLSRPGKLRLQLFYLEQRLRALYFKIRRRAYFKPGGLTK